MAFDPDAYLSAASAPKAFDPDAYLAEVAAPAAPSTAAVALNAPYKGVAGAIDALLNTPTNIANLGIAGYGVLKGAMGSTDLPEPMATPDYARRGLEAVGLIRPTPNMTPGQRVLDATLQSATIGALSPGSAARNAFLSAAGGASGQAMTEATGSPLAGMATSMLVPGAMSSLAEARQNALLEQQTRNAVRDQTLRAAQKEGLIVTPGSVSANPAKVLMEHIAGKSGTEQVASVKNQVQIDRLARRALGVAEDTPLTVDTTRDVRRAAFKQGYEPIAAVGKVKTDADFTSALDDILSQHTGAGRSFAQAIPDDVAKVAASYRVADFEAKDALKAIQTLRDKAGGHYRAGNNDLANAERGIAKALEDQIERGLATAGNPAAAELLDQFRQARRQMAISHTVEDAIHVGAGSVDARKLAKDAQSGKYLSDDLKTVAEFANTFRNVTKFPSGTPGIGGLGYGAMTTGGIAIPIGYSLGGPVGGAAATFGSLVAPAMARKYLLSDYMQGKVIPNYAPITNSLVGGGIPGAFGAVVPQMNRNAMAGP